MAGEEKGLIGEGVCVGDGHHIIVHIARMYGFGNKIRNGFKG